MSGMRRAEQDSHASQEHENLIIIIFIMLPGVFGVRYTSASSSMEDLAQTGLLDSKHHFCFVLFYSLILGASLTCHTKYVRFVFEMPLANF